MQKITTALLLAAGVCLNAASARAIENDYKPYLGVNYAYGEVRAEGAHAYHNSGSFNLGSVYNKYFGTELFLSIFRQTQVRRRIGPQKHRLSGLRT